MQDTETSRKDIREYYGKVLKSTRDLKTNACCTSESIPARHRSILSEIPSEILEKFYGCGSPIPPDPEGMVVLDLGCGSGRDAYLISKLVGPRGRVIGIDMTQEQLQTAEKHVGSQMEAWGFPEANLEFRQGFIEDLAAAGIENDSIDIVVSNCVLNLSPDKEAVYREIFRVLKPGGELYFSDVFAGRRIPAPLQADPIVRGECLGGAQYWEDFRRLMRKTGCLDFRFVSKRRMELGNPGLEAKVGMIDFHSATVRAFKIAGMEDICEDYGQTATYLGTLSDMPHAFALDDHHLFQTGKPMLVCGNTASMLADTRYARHFRIAGDRSVHYGPFDCAPVPGGENPNQAGGACC